MTILSSENYYGLGHVPIRIGAQLSGWDLTEEEAKSGKLRVVDFRAMSPKCPHDCFHCFTEKQRKTLSYVEWSTSGQESGNYTAEVKIMHNGEVVAENSFKFSIGHFQDSVWISAVSFLGGGNLAAGWFVIGGALLILAIIFDILRKKGINFSKAQLVFNNIRRLF